MMHQNRQEVAPGRTDQEGPDMKDSSGRWPLAKVSGMHVPLFKELSPRSRAL